MGEPEPVGTVTDPTALWKCGASYFPEIATQYAAAGAALGVAAGTSDSYFNRTEHASHTEGGFDSPGPVPYFLNQLRDELHRVLGESVDNLFDMGDALEKVAWEYAGTDEELRDQLEHDVTDLLDANDKGTDTDQPIWTDDERGRIKDRMDVPPNED